MATRINLNKDLVRVDTGVLGTDLSEEEKVLQRIVEELSVLTLFQTIIVKTTIVPT